MSQVLLDLSTGPVFGNMDQFTGLGVFVDTYPNADRLHDVSQPRRRSRPASRVVVLHGSTCGSNRLFPGRGRTRTSP